MSKSGTVLVTGGAGFIGSNLVDRMLAEDRKVVVIDNFDDYYDPRIKRRNIATALENPGYSLVEGDIRDSDLLDRVMGEHDIAGVVHLAARAGVRPSIEDPIEYTSVNLDGTTRLLQACRKHEIDRFIFGSSSSVYGNNEKVPFAEGDPVDMPISPYAATKKAGEILCHAYHYLFGINIACLRFFTVYGPRQRPEMAIHAFAAKMARGETIDQFGDGGSARDYTYVSDIVDGLIRALDRVDGYHIWNLGGSGTIQLGDLIQTIADTFEVEAKVRRLPAQPGDVERTWADTTLAKRDLGWETRVELKEGLKKFREWFETQASLVSGKTS